MTNEQVGRDVMGHQHRLAGYTPLTDTDQAIEALEHVLPAGIAWNLTRLPEGGYRCLTPDTAHGTTPAEAICAAALALTEPTDEQLNAAVALEVWGWARTVPRGTAWVVDSSLTCIRVADYTPATNDTQAREALDYATRDYASPRWQLARTGLEEYSVSPRSGGGAVANTAARAMTLAALEVARR